VLRVGLTGGIGAGKSEVSRRLAALGAVVLDADKVAREVVEPGTPGLAAIAARFGPGVLQPDGSLDRPKLGEIVFADRGELAVLNGITHPLIQQRMHATEAAAITQRGDDVVIVHDVALLAEGGRWGDFDLVIVVDAPERVQARRLVERRGMTEQQAAARMGAQATREQRLAIATIVIDNSGSLDDLDKRVTEVWATLRERAAASRRP
jgi:dephospho-CoA kinase